MERWGDKGATAARARRHADQPSFSSTLLDAIYKSMEDDPGNAGAEAATNKKQQQQEALHYNSYYYRPSLAGSYRARAPAPGPHGHATTSSSSEGSSYGGFSSSEAESSSHRRLRPIRTTVPGGGVPAGLPAPEKKAKKPAGASIRAKLRDLRTKPASPGARLAGFLNTIFAVKRAPQTPPSAGRTAAAEYACSSASSYSRSCLSKTPSTRGQANRTVRFMDSDGEAALSTAVPCADRRRVPAQVVEQMLLRRMEMESDEDEDDDDEEDEESSDASDDLFELQNFAAAVAPAGAAYSDELPVYETTRVVHNRGIGHGYAHARTARVV